MERTKHLPYGTYWDRELRRFVTPDDAAYDPKKLEELTLGPMERGLFSDEETSTVAA